jgi:hypothetical protein
MNRGWYHRQRTIGCANVDSDDDLLVPPVLSAHGMGGVHILQVCEGKVPRWLAEYREEIVARDVTNPFVRYCMSMSDATSPPVSPSAPRASQTEDIPAPPQTKRSSASLQKEGPPSPESTLVREESNTGSVPSVPRGSTAQQAQILMYAR